MDQGRYWEPQVTQVVKNFISVWNRKIHYRLHNIQPPDSTLNQLIPAHILIPYAFKYTSEYLPYI